MAWSVGTLEPSVTALAGCARVIGTGSVRGSYLVSSASLEERFGLDAGWLERRTGIVERRRVDPGLGETNSSLAERASQKALVEARCAADSIDQIIYATCTPDTLVPATACRVQAALGASNAYGFDLNAACSGFVYALALADQGIRSGTIRTSLVIGADSLSRFLDENDRGTQALMGDGAGAVVLSAETDRGPRIIHTYLGTDPRGVDVVQIPAGGSRIPVSVEALERRDHRLKMRGRETAEYAHRLFVHTVRGTLEQTGLGVDDIDWLIPHQANLRIIEAVASELGMPMSRVLTNIRCAGNTGAASIPMVLNEARLARRFSSGDLVLCVSVGAGFTFGSALLEWST